MKKLGTPIGAGPGSESEKLGLEADGTPLPVGSATFFLALALRWPAGCVGELVVVCPWLEGFCFLVGRLGAGPAPMLEDDEVEVELEVELEEDDDEDELELPEFEPLELELELGVEVELEVVVLLEELVLPETQLSDTTVAPDGSGRLEGAVPGGMLEKTNV